MLSRLLICTALIGSSSAALWASDTFSISATPNAQAVWQGGSTSYLVTISGSSGFSDVVSLSATSLPGGTTAAFGPSTLTGPGTSTLTVNASPGTSVGSYAINITGTAASGSQSSSAGLNVIAQQPVQYTYDALGRLVSVTDQNGASAVYNYDPAGNVLSITRQNVNQVNVAAFSPTHGSRERPSPS